MPAGGVDETIFRGFAVVPILFISYQFTQSDMPDLFPDAESREDAVEDVVGGGRACYGVNRVERTI